MHALTDSDPPKVGPFTLIGRLGQGGMGVVYAGQDATRRRAAVKVIQPGLARDPAFRSRFAREAVLLARIQGRCTANVLAADVDTDPAYLALEFVGGRNLAEQIALDGPLAPALLWPLAVSLLEALTAIHAAGVIHRDLKPANVILSNDGPKVIDFGIAHLSDGTSLITAGTMLGSPGWMAPEQLTADQVSVAGDVFAWAATVGFAATGRAPFGGGRIEGIYYRILNAEPDLDGVEPALARLLLAAMQKAPIERPSVADLLKALLSTDRHVSIGDATVVAQQATSVLQNTWHLTAVQEPWPAIARSARTPPQTPTLQKSEPANPVFRPAPPSKRRPRAAVGAALALAILAAGGGAIVLTSRDAAFTQPQSQPRAAAVSSPATDSSVASPSPSASAVARITADPSPASTRPSPAPALPLAVGSGVPLCTGPCKVENTLSRAFLPGFAGKQKLLLASSEQADDQGNNLHAFLVDVQGRVLWEEHGFGWMWRPVNDTFNIRFDEAGHVFFNAYVADHVYTYVLDVTTNRPRLLPAPGRDPLEGFQAAEVLAVSGQNSFDLEETLPDCPPGEDLSEFECPSRTVRYRWNGTAYRELP